MVVFSKHHKNHLLLKISCWTWDAQTIKGVPDIAELHPFPCLHFTANGQIAWGARWSVSAMWISIGNHCPSCFLKISAHQQQRLWHPRSSAMQFFFFSCCDRFKQKDGGRVQNCYTQGLQRSKNILKTKKKNRLSLAADIIPD